MPKLKCPVCGEVLCTQERTMKCPNGHSFDIAKQGYVNLLMSNKSSAKRHGDDRLMVECRQAFLEKGYYECLRRTLCDLAVKYCQGSAHILDVGCGEGWYTVAVKSALESAGVACSVCGVDISRQALIQASRRDKSMSLAVGSVNALPVCDEKCDLLLNIFAPNDDAEFRRVLRPGGILLRAVPLQRHLFQLKAAVYDKPYLNPEPVYAPEGFESLGRVDVTDKIVLQSHEDIENLFMMTPYYYKTGRDDQAKLLTLDSLETELGFGIFVLRRS
jgi:23S rRNA (guanine745-N1)-methyltransferase